MPDSTLRHVQTVENWIKVTGCIARPEVRYLRAEPYDLLNIGQVKDQGMSKVAHVIEHIAVFLLLIKRKVISPTLIISRTAHNLRTRCFQTSPIISTTR
jgi:hypothetical protein